jgi:hypothetical protein
MDGWMVKMDCARMGNKWMDGWMDELGSELTCRIRQEGRGAGAKFLI